MVRPRKWENDVQRRKAQNDERKRRRSEHNVHFVSVDGEGVGREEEHKYVLLGVGESQIENPDGLQFSAIAEHLYECYEQEPDSAFVGFFLGYDFTQWFKTLPEERARIFLTEEGRLRRRRIKHPQLGPFPVEYAGWEFDILGMKRFKLRPYDQGKNWMYVCDAGPFFQASLMSVINPKGWDKPVVTEEEYAILEAGKKERDTAGLDVRMRAYNRLENIILARLMDRTNAGLVAAGIRLKKNQWFGPGQAAQAWLSQIGAPSGESVRYVVSLGGTGSDNTWDNFGDRDGHRLSTPLLDAARSSYYGGWFEIMAHGHVPGDSWEYDINSAYPYIISRLPCLLHGSWRYASHGGERALFADYRDGITLVRGRVKGSDVRIGAMLHRRNDHSIVRPWETAGWYWYPELNAAYRAGLIDDIEPWESWHYDPCDCKCPLRGIAGLYDQRIAVGKNTPAGKAYKLVYNSVYGKFAQSIGEPKYGNSFYASLITSGCRQMILEAIAAHPEGTRAVLMVATDGVYFRTRHPALAISNKLGEWEETSHSNLTLFKPGIYWNDAARKAIREDRAPAFKARGISAKAFAKQISAVDNHFSRWPERFPHERDPDGPRDGWYPEVSFKSGFSMVTCQQALQRRKWHTAGMVGTQKLTQDADPILKRHSGYYENSIYWSRPYKDGGAELESTAYDRKFGQPDPEQYGINDDGNVKDQWAKMMQAR